MARGDRGSMEESGSSSGFSTRDAIITGCVVGGMLLIVIIILLVACCRRRFVKRESKGRQGLKRRPAGGEESGEPRYNTSSAALTGSTDRPPYSTGGPGPPLPGENAGHCLSMNVPISLSRRTSGYNNRKSDNVVPVKFKVSSTLEERLGAYRLDERRLKRHDVVGRSSCGIVYKGKLHDKHLTHSHTVLIKTLHGEATCGTEVTRFLEDVLQLRGFSHPRVLSFLGVVLQREQPYSVNPYPDNGILYTFITTPNHHFTVKELLRMSLNVAEGMKYLSDEGFLHKDLATRNCVVDKNRNVLITDSGLARTMFRSDYEDVPELGERTVPLRWMSTEAVSRQEFTTKSDVWSYGVLLWEMMTRCEFPYSDLADASAVIESIKTGKHPERPPVCPDKVHELMEECWLEDPACRPNFTHICSEIEALLNGKANARKSLERGTKSQYLKVIHASEY